MVRTKVPRKLGFRTTGGKGLPVEWQGQRGERKGCSGNQEMEKRASSLQTTPTLIPPSSCPITQKASYVQDRRKGAHKEEGRGKGRMEDTGRKGEGGLGAGQIRVSLTAETDECFGKDVEECRSGECGTKPSRGEERSCFHPRELGVVLWSQGLVEG